MQDSKHIVVEIIILKNEIPKNTRRKILKCEIRKDMNIFRTYYLAKPKGSQDKRHIIKYNVNFDCFTLFSHFI